MGLIAAGLLLKAKIENNWAECFEWHIIKKLPWFDTVINVCYLLRPFKVKKFSLLALPTVSLNLLENWLNRQYLKKMACDSVITDYFINFLEVMCISMLLWVDNLQLKETLKPRVNVNIEKNFFSDSSRSQALILGVNTGRKIRHWKVTLCSNTRGLCSENTC